LKFHGRTPFRSNPSSPLIDESDQAINCELAITVLRACFLSRDRNSKRPVCHGNGGRSLVYMLAARTTRARKMLFKIVDAKPEALYAIGQNWVGAQHAPV
jgi:hypothetical protein